ncbi:hypothetical protein AA309_08195 [Microvirga vignae]|uniref:Uncharacterized protein n=1 Tax=Microvirga vignae TaxID=1225564 RepID=A0A0H1REW1_9HYPH|nr:hypothetical protein [Microvirga vignae]KLK93624.1 hypothetical protein AA309_08195 [Microvirga vignae]
MTDKNLDEAIAEKLNLIAPTLKAIQAGGEQAYLGDLQTLLRKNLASLLALFERDPGLDAATADLYAAAAAIVKDVTAASQPYARKRRLLKEAQMRFEERIALARPRERRPSASWRQSELFFAA